MEGLYNEGVGSTEEKEEEQAGLQTHLFPASTQSAAGESSNVAGEQAHVQTADLTSGYVC